MTAPLQRKPDLSDFRQSKVTEVGQARLRLGAQVSPAVARNRDPILAILRRTLPPAGIVLEIASGTGEHAAHFAAHLPDLTWQPTDRDPSAVRSIDAYRAAANLPNLNPPIQMDVNQRPWPVACSTDQRIVAIVSINMIHIAPWSATEGLMAGAQDVLGLNDAHFLYGPFRENAVPTAPSNEAFDASLRARNPAWGLRDLDDVITLANQNGFDFVERVVMPANNLSVIFRRRSA
jgi:hypothetical protein